MISETPILVANYSYLSASVLAGQCIQNPLDLPPFPLQCCFAEASPKVGGRRHHLTPNSHCCFDSLPAAPTF